MYKSFFFAVSLNVPGCSKPGHVSVEVLWLNVSWRCWCFRHHVASVSQVVLKALRGEEWLCDRSFMVITLSRSSGQETSECNGSAGSPQYGFMKVQGWRGGSVTCFCFLQTPMNNVRALIQGDKFLTNNTRGLFLAVVTDTQSLLVWDFWRNFLKVWSIKCSILKRNKTVILQLSLCESKGYPLQMIHTHPHTHTMHHVAVHCRGPGRVGKGPLHVRGG